MDVARSHLKTKDLWKWSLRTVALPQNNQAKHLCTDSCAWEAFRSDPTRLKLIKQLHHSKRCHTSLKKSLIEHKQGPTWFFKFTYPVNKISCTLYPVLQCFRAISVNLNAMSGLWHWPGDFWFWLWPWSWHFWIWPWPCDLWFWPWHCDVWLWP